MARLPFVLFLVIIGPTFAHATFVAGAGGPKRTACRAVFDVSQDATISGKKVQCTDGAACDADGVVNGVCAFRTRVCVNAPDPNCPATNVTRVKIGTDKKPLKGSVRQLQDAAAAIPLPTSAFGCSTTVDLGVSTNTKKKNPKTGKAGVTLKTKPSKEGHFSFQCAPSSGPGSTTTTTATAPTTTSTTIPVGSLGPGVIATITGATVNAQGQLQITFTLTDGTGLGLTPVKTSTTNPAQARVRFTVARLDVDTTPSQDGVTATFTRYRNYILAPQTSPITHNTSNQPTYDSNGTIAPADNGAWTYTFGTALTTGFNGALTHTVGGQVERSFEGLTYAANPLFDFVPNGGAVTTVREVVTTQACNTCHDPLEAHGGNRREVKLCQLCHTDQAVDPDTGNSIEFLNMIHKIHRGNELPSVAAGPVGTKYSIIGFQQSETVWSEKVGACAGTGAPFNNVSCEAVGNDCGTGGSCSATTVIGVGFPQDLRECTVCHSGGANATAWYDNPSVSACASCHDTVNPGQGTTQAGPPGTNHPIPGSAAAQPEALCHVCHKSTATAEFDLSIPGSHTVPLRSTSLGGLVGEIVSATGTPGNPVVVVFRIRDKNGTPYTVLGAGGANLSRLAFAVSGPSTDYGAMSPLLGGSWDRAFLTATAPLVVTPGSLAHDGAGTWTYTFANNNTGQIPAGATGTWRIGMEARGSRTINGATVNEATQNPTLDFSVDGSDVVHRREIVDQAKCQACHGTLSIDFSVHGNLRNQVDYCVICHNAAATDVAQRTQALVTAGAPAETQSIHLNVLIHRIHTGENLERQQPYIVYGNGNRPVFLGEVLFPGNRMDCASCHINNSQFLPLPSGALPTATSVVGSVTVNVQQRVAATCLSCHDSDAALAHAATQTATVGMEEVEACDVCHAEGSEEAVSVVHAPAP